MSQASRGGFLKKEESYILEQVGKRLKSKYEPVLNEIETRYSEETGGKNSRYVWVCWLQGMENAPELVKVCYELLCKNINDREIVVLTNENLSQYVHLPEYIERKHEKDIIPDAAFTDMLRLEEWGDGYLFHE